MRKLIILLVFIAIVFHTGAQSWSEVSKLVALDRTEGDRFGRAVAISNNYAIVGAFTEAEDEIGENYMEAAGSAYIFERNESNNWIQVQKVVASDRSAQDWFGCAVAINGDYAIVGAKFDDQNENGENLIDNAGALYIFKRNEDGEWNQIKKLVATDRQKQANFGEAVSISGMKIISGSRHADNDAGAAYVFESEDDNWEIIHAQKIVASDSKANDAFGKSVSISNDFTIIGANHEDEDEFDGSTKLSAGSAYIFERVGLGNWQQVQKVIASDRDDNDQFGISVSIDNTYAVVGAHYEDEDPFGENSLAAAGSAYIFERDDNGIWKQVQKVVASDRETEDVFGEYVSINGKNAIIGAWGKKYYMDETNWLPGVGSAYIFTREENGNWSQSQKLNNSDPGEYDRFGIGVAIDGNNAIAGAFMEDNDAAGENYMNESGSAYLFEYDLTGINDHELATQIKTYPNPTFGLVTIDLGKVYQGIEVFVRSIEGQLIFTEKYKSTQFIDLEIKGSASFYFVEITTSEGTSSILKIVKSN